MSLRRCPPGDGGPTGLCARTSRASLAAVLACAVLLGFAAPAAWGATIEVTSECSFADALKAANGDSNTHDTDCTAGSGADTINLPQDTTIDFYVARNVASNVTTEITINGNGSTLRASATGGNRDRRFFRLETGAKLTINNLTLLNGNSGDFHGGAIRVEDGTLVVNNSTFKDNQSGTSRGAAIYLDDADSPSATITNTTFISNNTTGEGGAISIHGSGASLTVKKSSFYGNRANRGAAIDSLGTLVVENSTFYGNEGSGTFTRGTINVVGGSATLRHLSFIGNKAGFAGPHGTAISHSGGNVNVYNSIFADTRNIRHCSGTITGAGHLVTTDISVRICDGTYVSLGDLELGAVTTTAPFHYPLLDTSRAIGAGDATQCAQTTEDQRGETRPQPAATTCDVGAYESARATRLRAGFDLEVTDLAVSFTNATDETGSTAVTYSWDFGDGTDATARSPTKSYTSAGTYTVVLTATSDDGSSATSTQQVTVTAPVVAPTAGFTTSVNDLEVTFTSTATGTSLSHSWNFGDNSGTSTAQNPVYDYTSAGTYTVTLTVSNSAGSDSTTEQVTVTAPVVAPNAEPTFTSTTTPSVVENTTTVQTVVATDSDTGDSVTGYAIQGGADQSKLSIVEASGVLTFKVAPDFENPTDAGVDNTYDLIVRATSGSGDRALTADWYLAVTVTDDPTEAPGKPATPRVIAGSDATALIVTWTEPSNAGPPITDYDVQYRAGTTGSFTDWAHSGTGRRATITGLVDSTAYQVQVRAISDEGTGAWSDSGAGTTGVTPQPGDGNLRIVGGGTSGRLQIQHGGDWKGICDDFWDLQNQDNAGVACRQLGYRAGTATDGMRVAGDTDFLLDNVNCTGHEADLLACAHSGLNVHNCGASEHVGVSCSNAAPSAPRNLNAQRGDRRVALGWRAPERAGSTAIVRHEYAASEDGGTYGPYTAIPSSAPSESNAASYTVDTFAYIDRTEDGVVNTRQRSIANDKSYSFLVRAVNGSTPGTGGPSNEAAAGVNNAPTFTDGATTTRTVAENTAAGRNIGSAVAATDADADSLTYTLGGTDRTSFGIVQTSGQLRTNAALDYEAKPSYAVTVTASDGNDEASIAVTIDVTDVNEPPPAPAAPTVAGATVSSLTASWTAPTITGRPAIDGYDVRYRTKSPRGSWRDGPQDVIRTTATIPSLAVATTYEVQVRATNDEGDGDWSASGEGATSTAGNAVPRFTSTATPSVVENRTTVLTVVATDSDDSVTGYAIQGGADQSQFSIVEASGVLTFKVAPNFENPTDVGAGNTYVVIVRASGGTGARALAADQTITVTVTDDDTEAPGKPAPPSVTVGSEPTSLDVTWAAPSNAGPPITGYGVQYRAGDSGSFTAWTHSGTGGSTTITGLMASTAYEVQVRATNDEGTGDWSNSGVAREADDGDLRIVEGGASGRLQIRHGDDWKGICDDRWNNATYDNAGVACRQLGYRAGTVARSIRLTGDQDFLLDDVACTGHEADLLGCRHNGRNIHNCSDREHVAVSCSDAAPSAPRNLNAEAGNRQVALSWRAPSSAGDTAIVRHEYATNEDGGTYGPYTAIPDSAPSEANAASYTVDGIVNDKSYGFLVRAVNDSTPGTGGPSNEATATPTGSNNVPTFTDGETTRRSVAENTASGQEIGSAVAATDADDDTLTYTLGGTDAASFRIVRTNGQLRTNAALDYEAKSSYAVTVTVSDGTDTDTIAVTIDVTDVNEPPPAPAAPTVGGATVSSLTASWTAPTITGRPAITGYDVRYRTKSPQGSWRDGPQDVSGTTATIRSLAAATTYEAQVRAQNAEGTGGWSASGEGVTSTVGNAVPRFTSTNMPSVVENRTTVLTVLATDSDTDDTVTGYAIHGGADRTKFALNETSGALRFAAAPNFENPTDVGRGNTYVVIVRATSGTGSRQTTADQTITVTVTDDDTEAPGKPATPSVTAGSDATTLIATWAEPSNAGPPITDYGVQYRAGDSGSFTDWTHSGTGRSATITGLTATTTYQVQVQATNDEGTGAWSDSGAGTTGVAQEPEDGDLRIVGGGTSGRLQIRYGDDWKGICNDKWDEPHQDNAGVACRQLDYRAGSAIESIAVPGDRDFLLDDVFCAGHEADFLACGHAGLNVHNCNANEHVGVSCSDAAPSAPRDLNAVAGDGQVALSWRAPTSPGDTAIVRHEFAANEHGLRYEFWAWTAIPDSAPSEANAASYTVDDVVNGKSYSFLVRAVNGSTPGTGGPSNVATATLGGVNNAPTFTDGDTATRSVAENTAAGTDIGNAVSATDDDAGDTLTYTLGGTDVASFGIDASTGQIKTNAALDFETKQSYAVTVTVSDGNDEASIAVTIDVMNVAEPPPAPAAPTVAGATANSLMVSWTAPAITGRPAIDGYDVRYRTKSPQGPWRDGPQDVSGTTATIRSLAAATTYEAQVRAQNAEGTGGWSASGEGVTSTVGNAVPRFTSTATPSVVENRTTVLTVVATDADDSVTGYAIQGGADQSQFSIVEASGLLTFKVAPNYEGPTDVGAGNTYVVIVRATGGTGARALTADQTITVAVTDDDTEAPGKPAPPSVTVGANPRAWT